MTQAIFVCGVLRCSACKSLLRPGHAKASCCKAAYKRHAQAVDAEHKAQQTSATIAQDALQGALKPSGGPEHGKHV